MRFLFAALFVPLLLAGACDILDDRYVREGGSPTISDAGVPPGNRPAVCEPEPLEQCLARDPAPIPDLPSGSLCASASGPPLDQPPPVRIYQPTDRFCAPSSTAIVLGGQDEGLLLDGPPVSLAECLGGEARINALPSDVGAGTPAGYEVRFGDRLRYLIRFRDSEGELTLTRAELFRRNGRLDTRFYFAVTGGGKIGTWIEALLDGALVPSTPVSGSMWSFEVGGGRPRASRPCAELSTGRVPASFPAEPWCASNVSPERNPVLAAGREVWSGFASASQSLGEKFACNAETAVTLSPGPGAAGPLVGGLFIEEYDIRVNDRPVARVRIEGSTAGVLLPSKVELHRRFAFTDVKIDLAAVRPGRVTVTVSTLEADGTPSSWYATTLEVRAIR